MGVRGWFGMFNGRLLCFVCRMDPKFSLLRTVSFADVDREQTMTLSGVFQVLQEVAIGHANQFSIGTRQRGSSPFSWVLNRMAVGVHRYPVFEENLRIETWSRGISGFRGYREYRVFSGSDCVISGSSLWIFVDLQTKSPARVPEDVVANFPILESPPFSPELDRFGRTAPDPARADAFDMTLRYSDIDTNLHVNNTSYLELLQTALSASSRPTRPAEVQIKFMREILPETRAVRVLLETTGGHTLFNISAQGVVCAQGHCGTSQP
jgi:medium-chain acyl-[acyl-carrier-protein] hydrolase